MVESHSNSAEIEIGELFGLTEQHLLAVGDTPMKLHANSLGAFAEMQKAALTDGIQIQAASAYRSFERQQLIWNAKARGERDCLDDSGNCIDISQLTDMERVQAIMRFSALPGASRHHWGTDLDIYDASAVSEDYQPQLVSSEYGQGGPFFALNLWLSEHAAKFDFVRPYATDRGGIAPEAWHISHLPIAQSYNSALTADRLRAQIELSDIELKSTVLNNLQYLFERYIQIT